MLSDETVCKRLKLQILVIDRNFSRYPEHQISFFSILNIILDEKPLKECNRSREAAFIQTWYQNVFPQNLKKNLILHGVSLKTA